MPSRRSIWPRTPRGSSRRRWARRPIKVTAGGWNSDQQAPPIASAAVKDHVVYERPLEIAADAKGNVVKVLFGGCNYGAEVFLDDRKVAEHNAPHDALRGRSYRPAAPGRPIAESQGLHAAIISADRPSFPWVSILTRASAKVKWSDDPNFAYGLTGHVRLAIYPPVHIAEVFVRPRSAKTNWSRDVWIRNATAEDKRVKVAAVAVGVEGRAWKYPALPAMEAMIPAHSVK